MKANLLLYRALSRPGLVAAGAVSAALGGAWVGGPFGAVALASLCLGAAALYEHLHRSGVRLKTALDNMSQGLAMFDANERLVVCNHRIKELYRLQDHQIRPGMTLVDFKGAMADNGYFWGGSREEFLTRRLPLDVSNTVEISDGRVVCITRRAMDDGGWVVTHEDVTERAQSAAKILKMALHDSLTGLCNRAYFAERLASGLERAMVSGDLSALLYIDLDRFKQVNDTLGHPAGDILLAEVGRRLQRSVRASDVVARNGGDEFAILLEDLRTREDAAQTAQRILREMSLPFDVCGHQVTIAASVGIALSPEDGDAPDLLTRRADLALYEAKATGRGRQQFFLPRMEERARWRHETEADLRIGLLREEFELNYQPIVELQTGRIMSCEAILRWRHPVRGLISSAEFVPIAEESDLIVAIGEWVIRTACRDAAKWKAATPVAVNVSSAQLKPDLLAIVTRALEGAGLLPERLHLEITEPALLRETGEMLSILGELRRLGITFSLDYFGAGSSSIRYLRQFPFDNLKIDKSVMSGVCDSDVDRSIVSSIALVASGLRMTAIADGVERRDQADAVLSLGCKAAQGGYYSPPVPSEQVDSLVRSFAEAA
ncbi:MAG: EAL domain-containing protein [Beijerinckiaceae bacterium]|nr:EAL domain-containing protein [Beijerinckiaceae bacterium]